MGCGIAGACAILHLDFRAQAFLVPKERRQREQPALAAEANRHVALGSGSLDRHAIPLLRVPSSRITASRSMRFAV
jgi:hypothetical protein